MTTEVNSDLHEIRRIHDEYIVANRTGDTTWCRENMAPGADGVILFNTNGSNYHGVEHWCSLWDYYKDHIKGDARTKGEPPLFQSLDPRITVSGDAAWITYRLRMIGKIDGKPMPEMARGTEIYQRQDGSWKMVHGHWSIGAPGEASGGL